MIPEQYKLRFIEHFPVQEGDHLLPVLDVFGTEIAQITYYIHNELPRIEQVLFTIEFSNMLLEKGSFMRCFFTPTNRL